MSQISVCIATYNRCERLKKIIKIILKSSLSDFELVIADDSSTDGTEEMILSFNDKRIRYYRHDVNIGMLPNWDFVTRKATSPIVFRMDDDDYIDKRFLGKMVDLFNKNPLVVCAFSGYQYTRAYDFSGYMKIVDKGVFSERTVVEGYELITSFLMQNPFPGIHPSAVVFRYDVACKIGFFSSGLSDLSFAMALVAYGKVGYIPEALFFYMQHEEERASNSSGGSHEIKSHLDQYDPLNVVHKIYNSSCSQLANLPQIQSIRGKIERRHIIMYSCICLYTTRYNYHKRKWVFRAATHLVNLHPSLLLRIRFIATFIIMMGPKSGVQFVMKAYRKGRS